MKGSKANLILFTVITLTLLWNVRPSYGLRILGMFPLNIRSHFFLCERLMRGLAARGHQVDVYSHFPLKNPPANYTDYNFAGTAPQVMNNLTYEHMKHIVDPVTLLRVLMKLAKPVYDFLGQPMLQKLIHNPPRYDVLITDRTSKPIYRLVQSGGLCIQDTNCGNCEGRFDISNSGPLKTYFTINCYLAFGRHLNIPMVNVVTRTMLLDWSHELLGNPVNFAVYPSAFSEFGVPTTFFERLENVILSKSMTYSYYYHSHEQNAVVEKYFGPGFPNVVELQKDISLVLLNHHPALNGVRTHSPNVIPIGGLHIVEGQDNLPKYVQKFLDEAKDGFVYVSFGSMVRIETFPKSDLDSFYKTFEKIAPVRVLMKIAKPEELPPGLPSNVITYHWLPQVKVLKHKNIKAFVTHGGLMGTQESIYYGVPMIGFPLFADQRFNIESYVRSNMAIKLDRAKITEQSFTKAVKEIITNPVYKESTERTGNKFRDVPMDPMDTAAFWVEYVARHGKNALRPPVVDLSWWQASLIDVYAFILLVVITTLYIIKVLIKKIVCTFSSTKTALLNGKVKQN